MARWVVHRPGSKVPLNPATLRNASVTDPHTWSDYAAARATGLPLGYVLGAGIGCIDLDHCLEGEGPTRQAEQVLDSHPGAWVEVSPSGTGLHIWGLAPEAPGTRRTINGLSIETYSVARYVTITGRTWRKGSLRPLQV